MLACVSGTARIGFGGDSGFKADVAVGDVCVIPAGVGHRRLDASADFQMAGGYPPGQEGNIVRPGEIDVDEAIRAIGQLALPATDPITGHGDGIVAIWRHARPRRVLSLSVSRARSAASCNPTDARAGSAPA